MAGFEPRKDYQTQTITPGPGVSLSENPLIKAGVSAVQKASVPPASGQLGVYAPQQLPPAGLPLGASAGGKPLPVQPVVDAALKVSGAGAATSAVPPAAPTPAAQGAKPGQMMTQPEQQAADIQQRSQTTPAAGIGAAPGKQRTGDVESISGMGIHLPEQRQRLRANRTVQPVPQTGVPDAPVLPDFQMPAGINPNDPFAMSQVLLGIQAQMLPYAAQNMQRKAALGFNKQMTEQAAAMEGAQAAHDRNTIMADNALRDEDVARLGIGARIAGLQQARELQMAKVDTPAPVKTEMRTLKVPTGRTLRGGESEVMELQVAYNPDGTLTPESAAAVEAALTPQVRAGIDAEDRSWYNPMRWLEDSLSEEEKVAATNERVGKLTQQFGVGGSKVQQAQIDPSQVVWIDGKAYKPGQ